MTEHHLGARKLITLIPHGLGIFISAVFIDSLRYKFINHPKTETIFGILNEWAGTLGFPGLFSHEGVFSAYMIGSAELIASVLLLIGIIPALRTLQGLGAALAFLIMTGALSFHLFTPLGIDPNNDGGGLFITACMVWGSSFVLMYVRRKDLVKLVRHGKPSDTQNRL